MNPCFVFKLGLVVAAVCASIARKLASLGGPFAIEIASLPPDGREPVEANAQTAQAFGRNDYIIALTLQRTVLA